MVTKEKAQELLEPYYPLLINCIDDAWSYYQNNFQKDQFRFEKRTRAGIIRDLMVDNVKTKFYGLPDIFTSQKSGLFLLAIKDTIFAKFKKLKDDFTPSNILTHQTNLFFQGELFSEYENSTYVHVGYVVDKIWENIAMYISCTNGSSVNWIIKLDKENIITEQNESEIDFLDDEEMDSVKNILKPRYSDPSKKKSNKI